MPMVNYGGRQWPPTLVFLSLEILKDRKAWTGYSPRGHKSDMSERLALSHLILHIKLFHGIGLHPRAVRHIPVTY